MGQKTKRQLIYIGIILVVVLIMLTPMFTKNHIYQGVALGGDTRQTFIPLMNMATNGGSFIEMNQLSPYLGLTLLMWCVGVLNRVLNMNPEILFYLYSLVVLFGAGVTLYYLGKMVAGARGGWIVLIMGMLANTSILALYTWGCTINILNVYIILLWSMMLFVRWFQIHKWYWLISAIILCGLFTILHPTGLYLPFAVTVFIMGLVIWAWIVKKKINWWHGAILFVFCIGGFCLTWRYMGAVGLGMHNMIDWDYIIKYFRLLLLPIPAVIGIMVLIAWWKNKKHIEFNVTTKLLLAILASLFVVVAGASLLQATILPERQILDASAIMAIMIAIVLATLLKNKELEWLKVGSYALVSLGGLVTIHGWLV
jgi:hypothetical protein